MDLAGVEIFRSGRWNGDPYSVADLDEMVANFPLVGFQVPVKLGHADDPGEPAYGWVQSVRRLGDRLVADLIDLPEKVFRAIKERRFDAVSSEIFWDLERDGKTFRRVLKAVSLLGAEIPAVADLKPLREVFRGLVADEDEDAEYLGVYSLKKEILTMEAKAYQFNPADPDCRRPGREVDVRVRRLQAQHPSLKYSDALNAVLNDPDAGELKEAFALHPNG